MPNQCWQADVTHWHLARGGVVILNILDDHSRLLRRAAELAHKHGAQAVQEFGSPYPGAARGGYGLSLRILQPEADFQRLEVADGAVPATHGPTSNESRWPVVPAAREMAFRMPRRAVGGASDDLDLVDRCGC